MTTQPNPNNVDESEIRKFSAWAEYWWDTEGEFKPLHQINPIRLDFIRTHSGDLNGKKIIDVGCGGGILTEALAAEADSICGIDMAERSLAVARAHAAENGLNNITYRCISVEDLAAAEPAGFDIVVCMEMLEHVPDPASVIRACAKLAKPQGSVFFSTLNRNTKSYLQAIIAAEYLLGLVSKGTHSWKKFITPAELARMCRQSGLNWHAAAGLTYHPLTGRYTPCDNLDVNYMVACRPVCAQTEAARPQKTNHNPPLQQAT